MTDSTGLFQHAMFTVPNFSEGYCTDDNARAFILAVLLDEMEEEPERVRTLATTYAAFLHHAFDPETKRFHNHLSFDRRWLDEQGSEDCHGRALWALGLGVGPLAVSQFPGRCPDSSSRRRCRRSTELHLAARVGFRPARHSRIPAPAERRSRWSSRSAKR